MFGQSASTNTFGQPSAFNASATPFGAMNSTQTQQPSMFGQTSNPMLFGMNQSNNSIFGSPNTNQTNTFGTQSSTFGSNMFGNTNQQQSNTLFGSANRFSMGTTSTFANTLNVATGTTIKFVPQNGTDTIMKNGHSQSTSINIRLQCITCMREYESKSLEELRFEDYNANRKGPQQSNIFSSPLNTGTGFGSTNISNNFGSATSNQSSIFAQNKTGFGSIAPTTTTTSIFNSSLGGDKTNIFGSAATNTGTGFQTQQNQPSLFNISTSQVGNSLFGSNNLNANTTIDPSKNLYGNTTSQPNTSFNPNNQNALGNKMGFGVGNLFGNPSQTSTIQFGSNSTNPINGFGATSQSAFNTNTSTNNTLGSKPFNFSFSSAAPQLNTSALGTTTSTANMFGGTNSTFGSNTGSSFFGSNLGSNSFGSTTQPFQSSSFQFNPTSFGTSTLNSGIGSNLLNNNSQQALTSTASLVNTDQIITRLQTLPYGNSPQLPLDNSFSVQNIKTKFTTDPKTLNQYKINAKSQNDVKIQRIPSCGKPTTLLFDGLDDESSENLKCAQDIFQPRQNIKKLILNKSNNNSTLLKTTLIKSPIANESVNFQKNESPESEKNGSASKQVLENTMDIINKLTNDAKDNNSSLNSNEKSFSYGKVNYISEPETTIRVVPKCGIILTRTDYYTIPSLDECDTFYDADNDTCIVDSFTVGRIDYGSIYWKGPLNVKGLNLDEIVHIRRKEVIVYPDDDAKPPIGEALNRPAQVTLDQVWPIDKSSREFIKDPERLRAMKYSEKVEKGTIKLDAIFKEYRPDTGSWVFTVKHFSKYGLDVDDDEVEVDNKSKNTDVTVQNDQKEIPKLSSEKLNFNTLSSNVVKDMNINDDDIPSIATNFLNKEKNFNQMYSDFAFPMESQHNKVFNNFDILDDEEMDEIKSSQNKCLDNDQFSVMRSALFFDQEEQEVETVTKKCKNLSFTKSVTSHQILPSLFPSKFKSTLPKKRKLNFVPHSSKLKADVYSYCYSPFPKVNFINGSNRFSLIHGSEVLIYELDVANLQEDTISKLEDQLFSNSSINIVDDIYPPLIQTKNFCLNAKFNSKMNSLVEALFGELSESSNYSSHQERIRRIESWLFNYNKNLPVPSNPFSRIIHFLTTNELEFATTECINMKQPRLSYLISFGPFCNKSLILLQLDHWKRSEADVHINKDYLKIYVLLSGQCKWTLSNGDTINYLEGLEWTQQLVLILLYKNQQEITDSQIIGTNLVKTAIEEVITTTNDVEYHLLARHQPWVAIASCHNIIDSWFLLEALTSYNVIIDDIFTNKCDSINIFLASQIHDLRWSIFFALHIKNNFLRNYFLNELLCRNAVQLNNSELESFLKEKYLISQSKISEAKLFYSMTHFNHKVSAFNLIDCQKYNEAHDILINKVFPELVINEDYKEISDLISKLKSNQSLITNWNVNGAGLYEIFIQLLKFSRSSNLKKYKELVENFNVHKLRCPTKRHVLCQSQMARVANIIHAELNDGLFAYNTSVPDDYALLELRYNAYKILEFGTVSS